MEMKLLKWWDRQCKRKINENRNTERTRNINSLPVNAVNLIPKLIEAIGKYFV